MMMRCCSTMPTTHFVAATMHPNTQRRNNVAMMMRGETTMRCLEEEGFGWCLAAQQKPQQLLQQRRRRTKATTRVAARRRGGGFEDDHHHHHHSESSPERRKKENAAKKKKNEMSSPIADADADPRLDHPEMDAPRRESGASSSSSSSSSFARDQSKAPNDNQQHSKKKKKKTPTTKKKNPNATATRTATTKENVKISNASATKNGKKTTTAATNANANVTTKEEEEALPKKEEEEVEDEDQAPKHETTVLSKEQFQMQKKRLELLIEEKEWAVEEARDTSARSSVKLQRVLDYVNAVEAYKELCSSRVPDTVSDFLGNYVNVLCLPKHAKGYDEALSFLGIDFEDLDEDDLEITHEDFMRETEHYMRIEQRYDSERKSAKGSIEDQDEYYDDDDDEYYDDDDELLDALLGGDANYIAEMKLPLELHLAQDIDGNWRWLEDDLGRVLRRKPEGDFIFRLMSFEDLMNEGLNVNCLREEVDPNELIDFSKCRSFEDARRAMKEATDALRNMEADGWVVEKSFSATATSWGASSSGDSTDSVFDIKEEGSGRHLCMTKELRPLRTMSHVDGLHPEEDEKSKREVIRREEAAGAMAKDAFDSFDDNE